MATNKPWYYLSAYALAVKHGFNGTEQEWLALLKGEQGIQGIQGESAYEVAKRAGGADFPYATEEAWASAVDAAKDDAAASAASAAARQAAAQVYAESAADYALHIGDETAGIVADWLEEHISGESEISIDSGLVTEGAAADAKATGDAIKASAAAVDEYGSSYNSQNELYLHHQQMQDCPEYTYHFADSDYVQPGYRYTKNDTTGVVSTTSTADAYMISRLLDYDDTLVIHIPAGAWNLSTARYALVLGHLESGTFVPEDYVLGNRANGVNAKMMFYKSKFADYKQGKILLQIFGAATTKTMLKSITFTKRNPLTSLEPTWTPALINEASKRFMPKCSSTSTAAGKRIPSTTSVAGRLPVYWSTRLTRNIETITGITHAAGDTTTTVTPTGTDSETFVMAYKVAVYSGKGHKSLYSSSYSAAATGALTVNGIAYDGTSLKTSAADDDELITKIVYEYVKTTGSPITRKPCHQWLYAGGLSIDAIFYDKAGNEIGWYDDGGGTLAASVSSCLNLDRSGYLYPSSIKIPDNAVSFHWAVSGPNNLSASGLAAEMVGYFGYIFPDICVMGKTAHLPISGLYRGHAVTNARKLNAWKYPVESMGTRNVLINWFSGGYDWAYRTVTGIPYATGVHNMLGTDISFYTFLSYYRRRHGTWNGNADTWSNSSMSFAGLMCAAYASLCCGLPHFQGVEYWVHTYADKLEPMSGDTVLQPGDLVLYFAYRKKTGKKEDLYSHVSLISDGLFNQETGEFSYYERAECAESWTELGRLSAGDMGKYLDDEREGYEIYRQRVWRLPMPMKVTDISNNYIFSMDKLTDPIKNPVIEFPPVVSNLGDRCIVGGAPNGVRFLGDGDDRHPGYSNRYVGYDFYTLKTHSKVVVNRKYRNEIDHTYAAITASGTAKAGNFFYSFNLSDIMTTDDLPNPGVYTITAYDDEDNAATPAVFLIPEHPGGREPGTGISISNDGKIVTISGAHVVGTDDDEATKQLSCKSDQYDNVSFDQIWVRVMPKPSTVRHMDGHMETLPWGNYMYIKGCDKTIWDSVNNRLDITAEDSPWARIVELSLINTDFGGVRYRFTGDYSEPIDDIDEYDEDPGDNDGEASLQDGE